MIGLAVVGAITLGILGFLTYAFVKVVRKERTGEKSFWREFGLGVALLSMFLVSWVGHGISEWLVYSGEQETHDEPVKLVEFLEHFARATMENWQSEFLQLGSAMVLGAWLVFKGAAESRDSEDEMLERLKRIEDKLDGRV